MKWSRQADRKRCDHESNVTGYSTGVKRVTCQSCGYVSFKFQPSLAGPVERETFARLADDMQYQRAVGHI